MQPRIEPPPARGDEAELHSQLRRDLERVLARHVTASRDLIEDACQFAWLKLLDSHPERSSLFGWLYVVALHEAYRLLRIERRALHSSAVGSKLTVDDDACTSSTSRSAGRDN